MHTHGPHVTGESPGDNVFIKIEPQETHKYNYHFDENHMLGTFWYHLHLHLCIRKGTREYRGEGSGTVVGRMAAQSACTCCHGALNLALLTSDVDRS